MVMLVNQKLPKDLLSEAEHFQNLFICQKEVIDQLRHDLPDSRNKVEHIFRDLRSSGRERNTRHEDWERENNWESATEGLEDRMDTFRKIYIGIKQDFHRFGEDWR